MKFSIVNKFKIWIILTLVVIVSGLTVLGFLGFNNATPDKPYYEVTVSVDQDVKSSAQITESSAKDFFNSNNLSYASYSVQKTGLNTKFIFKFSNNVSDAIDGLEEYIETQINDAERDVEVKLYQAESVKNDNLLKTLLCGLIALAIIFVVSLISYKLKSALSIIISSILAVVTFIAITALSRIPTAPFITVTTFVSLILSVVLSLLVVNGYSNVEKLSGNEKLSCFEIADASVKASLLPIIVFAICLIAISVGICFGLGYSLFLALQVLVANVCAVYSACVITPLLLSALKYNKYK